MQKSLFEFFKFKTQKEKDEEAVVNKSKQITHQKMSKEVPQKSMMTRLEIDFQDNLNGVKIGNFKRKDEKGRPILHSLDELLGNKDFVKFDSESEDKEDHGDIKEDVEDTDEPARKKTKRKRFMRIDGKTQG